MTDDYYQALELANRSRDDLAERLLRQALAQDADQAGAHSLVGVCLARLGRRDDALAAAGQGVRLDPTAAYSYYAGALVLHRALEPALAAKDMEEAIRIDPTDPDYFAFSAQIYEDLLKFRQSLTGPRTFLCIKYLLLVILIAVLAAGFGTARLLRELVTRAASFVVAMTKVRGRSARM
jgi:tetratricopeptide (TPR) repeat protein